MTDPCTTKVFSRKAVGPQRHARTSRRPTILVAPFPCQGLKSQRGLLLPKTVSHWKVRRRRRPSFLPFERPACVVSMSDEVFCAEALLKRNSLRTSLEEVQCLDVPRKAKEFVSNLRCYWRSLKEQICQRMKRGIPNQNVLLSESNKRDSKGL